MLRRAWALSLHINSRAATQSFSKIFSRLEKIPVAERNRSVGGSPLPSRKTCPSPGNIRTPQHCSRTTCIAGLCMASGGDAQNSRPGHSGRYINRLSKERSPYLLQHAHNPVDWFPWGQEALDKAKKEDKPIFLSVGYSTCHWCHVMERESFEDVEIGKILSDNFVCIKVDREERPDVDKLYMTFVQWQSNREALESSGKRVIEALKKATAIGALPGQTPPHAPKVAQRCFHQLAQSYEEEYGGFRESPKFPTPVNLMFLMSFWATNRSTSEGAEALQMALHTMRMMALGGIRDHVAQGFHRYSTDSSWHVPHFEKMLYDQAQLAVAYITAYQVSGEQLFADVARDVLRYVSRDLSDKSGGFYSAEDADSFPTPEAAEKREGAFCVWTAGEIRELLPEPVEGATGGATRADIFMHHYGVKEQGNVDPTQDPHGELSGQNVLIVRYSLELTAARFGLSMEEIDQVLAEGRRRLAEVRKTRPPPHLDTKMLSSWNGLMLSGFARVGAALGDKALVERAVRAAQFLRDHLWDEVEGRILHACYRGNEMEVEQIESPIAGFLDDYAFVICGLLDLHEATLNTFWLGWAEELQQRQDQLFWDSQGSGYFCSDPRDATLLLALKQDQDGAEPSANSVSAMNLLRLSLYTGRQEWASRSEQLLTAFSDLLVRMPISLPDMVRGLMAQHYTLKQVVICGQLDSEDTASLVSCVSALFLPHKVLMLADGDTDGFLYQRLPVLATLRPLEGRATAYVCQNFACTLPVTCPQELRRQLLE